MEIADISLVEPSAPVPMSKSSNLLDLADLASPPTADAISDHIRSLAALSRSVVLQLSQPPTESWADQVRDVATAFMELGATLRELANSGPPHAAWEARLALFRFDHPDTELSNERTLDAAAAQFLLNLSKARVYQLASSGRIGTRVGDSWRFSYAELRQFAASNRPSGVHSG